jgi:hypothetical protein
MLHRLLNTFAPASPRVPLAPPVRVPSQNALATQTGPSNPTTVSGLQWHRVLGIGLLIILGTWTGLSFGPARADEPKPASPPADSTAKDAPEATPVIEVDPKLVEEPVRAVVSGNVVFLAEALARRDIKSYPEELKGQVVLETTDGRLLPIIPDWRGRAFFQDARLRNRPVDLLVRQRKSIPHIQVLSIFTFDEQGARQLTDYWCDICSIPMYEIKDCECCQGPIRLRFQPKDLPSDLSPPKPPQKKATTPDTNEAK